MIFSTRLIAPICVESLEAIFEEVLTWLWVRISTFIAEFATAEFVIHANITLLHILLFFLLNRNFFVCTLRI